MMEITLNGKEYELPKRTPKIARLFDDFKGAFDEGDVQIHNKAMKVLEATIGNEGLRDVFGTADSEQISVIDSVLIVKQIDDVYLAPLVEYTRRKESEEMNTPAFSAANELLGKMGNLQNLK